MSDTINSSVRAERANIFMGKGDLGDLGDLSDLLKDPQGKTTADRADDQYRRLRQRFVPPPGFGDAQDVLETSGTVFLDGAPGSGRGASVSILLGKSFQELLLETKPPRIPCDQVDKGDHLLLNLSNVTEQLWREIHAQLSHLRAVVRDRSARLVVVLPPGRSEELQADLYPYRVRLGRPESGQVLRRHLRMGGIPVDVLPAVAEQYLRRDPAVEEIAAYAARILEAQAEGGDLHKWCENAYKALTERDNDARTEIERLQEGHDRALLLTVAMLEGAHADVVHSATASLLEAARHPPDESPLLDRTDLETRLHHVKATLDSACRVRFSLLGMAPAVRRRFWRFLPDLRRPLMEWIRDMISSGSDVADHDALVARLAELCLAEEHGPMLASFVLACAEPPYTRSRLRASAQALRLGLEEPSHGGYFRRQIYGWVQSPLQTGLAGVLVETCRDVMSLHHPDQAMVRLHHMARRERGTTRAQEAFLDLVRSDAQLHLRALNRLHDKFQKPYIWPVDQVLFLELADPAMLVKPDDSGHALADGHHLRAQLAEDWQTIYERTESDVWGRYAADWLRTAASSPEPQAGRLLRILVAGNGQRPAVLSRLYVLAPSRFRERVLHEINRAQEVVS